MNCNGKRNGIFKTRPKNEEICENNKTHDAHCRYNNTGAKASTKSCSLAHLFITRSLRTRTILFRPRLSRTAILGNLFNSLQL